MKRLFLILCLVTALALGACATSKSAAECPDTSALKCLTARSCSLDSSRNCMACTCQDSWETRPMQQDQRLPQPGVP